MQADKNPFLFGINFIKTAFYQYIFCSRFTLRIPLTLTAIDAFLVRVADEIYIIPVNSV